jgi:MFS family permease
MSLQEPIKRELDESSHGIEVIEHEIEERQHHHPIDNIKEKLLVSKGSIVASILSTLFLRIGSRTSFVILGFYLGKNFESAVLAVVVIEAFYISELVFAPLIGALSDRKGRKPYMLYAPVVGSIAVLMLALASIIFPRPNVGVIDLPLIALLLMLLVGRLLEGMATALNAPANLGYLADATIGSDRLRARVVTAFEVATVGGISLAIPFGGQVYRLFGTAGFGVVIAIYAITYLCIYFFMEESLSREEQSKAQGSVIESLSVIKEKRIFTFIPSWLAVNMFLGAALTLTTIILAYPTPNVGKTIDPITFPAEARPTVQFTNSVLHDFKFALAGQDADTRHPNQLLYGGFTPSDATMIVGAYGLVFLVGMGIWMLIVPRLRRTTVMMVGLIGLVIITGILTFYNSLGENPAILTDGAKTTILFLLPLLILGVILMSGFTPASLIHLAAISETLPGKRGAVMGLYSVLLGVGQFIGAWLGGIFVDMGGFYGLMIYSAVLSIISLGSVLYMRSHNHDLIKSSGH